MTDRLTGADLGDWQLLTSAGRVDVRIETRQVIWSLARDRIGVAADVPSAAGDALRFPLVLGEVPRLSIVHLGQFGGEMVLEPRSVELPASWRVDRIRQFPAADEFPELFVGGRVQRCLHDVWHAAGCCCVCQCCDGRHREWVDLNARRSRIHVVTQQSTYVLEPDGNVVRLPDGDERRKQVMRNVRVLADSIALGERLELIVDETSARRTSAVRALIVE